MAIPYPSGYPLPGYGCGGGAGVGTFAEFLERRRQYTGYIDRQVPYEVLLPAPCGHCGMLQDLRRDWDTYSHIDGDVPPDLVLDGSLAQQIEHIAFEGSSCFTCAKKIFLATTDWIDEDDGYDTPLHYAARSGNLRMLFHLLCLLGDGYGHEAQYAVLVLRKLNGRRETALHEAIRLGTNSMCMVGMLMWVDPHLALHPRAGTSPLYLAVSLGEEHIAKMLHRTSGGNLSYSGPDGQNALHAAVHHPYGMVQLLLDWNNDLSEHKDKNGCTPLHSLVSVQSEDYIPRFFFCFHNVKSLLEKHATRQVLGANPSAAYQHDSNGLLPVHIAALMDRKVAIGILLKRCRGCIALRDKQGRSFLHIAVKNKVYRIVKYACQERVFAPILNARDNDGYTALHVAVEVGDLFVFCYLLRNPKVLLNVRNNKDETPLDLARSKKRTSFYFRQNPEIVIHRTLIDAGARHGSFWRGHVQQLCIQNQLSNLKDVENQSKEVVEANHKKKEKKEKKDSDEVTESSRALGILSVLITTVTFGAAFSVPPSIKQADNSKGDNPRLFNAWYFSVFMLANAGAFVYSSIATLCLMISSTSMVKLDIRRAAFRISTFFASHSLTYLTIAFALGIHIVLAPAGRTIAPAIYTVSLSLLLWQHGGSVGEIFHTYKPLSVRRGHKFAFCLFIRHISLWAISQLWPFTLFIYASAGNKPIP
ncbi:hypothetical protein VPH35_051799 [Triticum aestivum]|uniref:PGG domain-containing protein n=4 Tax=Triticum TaxID=4564 RepID=A0A9R1Q461_TRITD|nr:unnamed protein product [Triticum turgidum subsp. durum]